MRAVYAGWTGKEIGLAGLLLNMLGRGVYRQVLPVFDVVTWFLAFARLGAILALFPIFTGNVPVIIRISLSALVAFLVLPGLPVVEASNLGLGALVRLMVIEISVGLLLGFICRLVFYAIELGASVIASEMGLSMSNVFNSMSQDMMSTPGVLLYWLAVMLLFSLDMHHWLLAGFQKSFQAVPIGAAGFSKALYGEVIARGGQTFFVAVQMVAPVLACSFLVTLIFSLLGRVVPQMNVFAESFPVKSLAGLFVFGTTCTLMAAHITNYLKRLPGDFLRVAQLLGSGG
jgi:flagellar biosynthetic protein FliR